MNHILQIFLLYEMDVTDASNTTSSIHGVDVLVDSFPLIYKLLPFATHLQILMCSMGIMGNFLLFGVSKALVKKRKAGKVSLYITK